MARVTLSSHHSGAVTSRCDAAASTRNDCAVHGSFMHRRWFLVCVLPVAIAAGCSHPRPPGTVASPAAWTPGQASSAQAGRQSLGDPTFVGERHGCPGGLTDDECALVDSAILALEKHPAYQCRAVGDSARVRLYRGQLDFVQRTMASPGNRRRLDQTGAPGQPGNAWIGADQFDRRAVVMESMTRALTTDSLRRDSVAALCRRTAF